MIAHIAVVTALTLGAPLNKPEDSTAAERLHAEAVRVQEEGTQQALLKAARLYRRAAFERAKDDGAAITDLLMAGRLFHYVDKDFQAMQTMLEAADRALSIGEVVSAGEAYAYAAWLAERQDRGDLVLEYAGRAKRLAASPLLTAVQRRQILRHFSAELLAAAA